MVVFCHWSMLLSIVGMMPSNGHLKPEPEPKYIVGTAAFVTDYRKPSFLWSALAIDLLLLLLNWRVQLALPCPQP